jgi:hypothetical protein
MAVGEGRRAGRNQHLYRKPRPRRWPAMD